MSGLFAPRAGQHFRDEQRRRRSQYDRGTRLAELEDAYDYTTQAHYPEDFYRSHCIANVPYSSGGDGYQATY